MSHRLPVAVGAQQAGFQVHIATRPGDAVKKIVSQGFLHHELPLSRSGKNPFSELYLLTYVWRLLWRLRPDVLHLVTIKPVIYGGIAASSARPTFRGHLIWPGRPYPGECGVSSLSAR
ncbi:TPA: glycosyltransferase [Pseudomonas aeruginosa]